MERVNIKILNIILIIMVFESCRNDDSNKRYDFYTASSYDASIVRLPVIQPYELYANFDTHLQWQLNFEKSPSYVPIYLKKIAVHENYIFLYTDSESIYKKDIWFIVNSTSRLENKFYSRQEFISKKVNLGIDTLSWYNIDSVFFNFDENCHYPPGWPRKTCCDSAVHVIMKGKLAL